jgi:hypothetical protein
VRQGIQGNPAQHVGRIVSLPKSGSRVGIFMGDHREDQHGKGEHEIADLSIQ